MEVSIAELATLPFLILVALWIFTRKSQASDRLFLAISSLIYVAVMGITISFFGTDRSTVLSIVLESFGFALVWISYRLIKKKKSQEPDGSPIN